MYKKRIGYTTTLSVRPNGPTVDVLMSGVVGFIDGPQKEITFRLSPCQFQREYEDRVRRVRLRNRDITDEEVTNLVFMNWFHDKADSGTDGWGELIEESKWNARNDR